MDTFSFFMVFNVVIHVKIEDLLNPFSRKKNSLKNEYLFNFPRGMTLQRVRFLEELLPWGKKYWGWKIFVPQRKALRDILFPEESNLRNCFLTELFPRWSKYSSKNCIFRFFFLKKFFNIKIYFLRNFYYIFFIS